MCRTFMILLNSLLHVRSLIQRQDMTGEIHIGDGWASVRLRHSMPSLYNVGKMSIDNVNINPQ
jgi:hypothetical protein